MLIEYIGNQGTASWSTTENGNVQANISQIFLSWYIFQIISYRTFSQGNGPTVVCPMSTKCSRTVYGQNTLALG